MRRVLLFPALALALAACGNSNEISDEERDQFVNGCTQTAPKNVSCACVFDELKKAGYDTEDKFEQLAKDLQAAGSNPSAIPKEFVDAVRACVKS